MKIAILGATGATGLDLLEQALAAKHIEEVRVFMRRKIHLKHPKLICYVVDFNQPKLWQHEVMGDAAFSCLGTTLKIAGSKKTQYQVDYTYQYEFAQAAKQNGISQFVLVSSVGASEKSHIFYSQMKGQLEVDIKALNFNQLLIFRPPSLIRTATDRKAEVVGVKTIQALNKIGLFRQVRPLPTAILAQSMLKTSEQWATPDADNKTIQGIFIISGRAIWRLAEE
ncbi:MAG: NAD(P)H-binding protein [Mangrovibacterium sp.]